MPILDGTSQGIVLTLAIAGVFLSLLSLANLYFFAKRRGGKYLFRFLGFAGALVLASVGGLHFLLPTPEKLLGDAKWYTVDRGNVTRTMVASGEVEAADVTDVVVGLHSPSPGVAAGVIRWVIDNGKMVKKGDLLVEMDDSEWQQQLTEQPMAPARRKFVEEQIANCRMLAPRDGLAIYWIPKIHMGPGHPWLGPDKGELVQEGQRLLSIFDPSKLVVETHISQSQIIRVRLGQPARVHVNRFPNRTFRGQVTRIMPTARAVWVSLSDPVEGLRPDMDAEVSIELGRGENVLRLPKSSLMLSENQTICFVKSGWFLETRVVSVELGDSQFVEIIDGLKEGEQVLLATPRQQLHSRAKER